MLDQEAIDEYKKIALEVDGRVLTDAEAEEEANRVFDLISYLKEKDLPKQK